MSEMVDRRVVEMRFDNKDFEQNVSSTLTVLEKLKEKLSLKGAEKEIGPSGLGSAVDGLKERFSALEVVGMTTLVNLTNSAVNLGKKLAKSLTVDQIHAGFSEYELKMGSIQTIMASTGEDIQTVNEYLNKLNAYSDKTIYSFSDMTSSIGKFTNAGVHLDDAVAAIQGVSNVAAVSGANAQEASRAMYNFAQALSAGSVKLIDWKSIENANMATVEFKQQLLDTAVALGTVVETEEGYVTTTTNAQGKVSEAFTTTKGFNDALAHQWMTTDVLTQTLSNYSANLDEMSAEEKETWRNKLRTLNYTDEQIADIEKLNAKAFAAAQDVKTFSQLVDTVKESIGSGWAQTFELIFGNLEEAKVLWTAVNKEISAFVSNSSDARNNLLQGWKETKITKKQYKEFQNYLGKAAKDLENATGRDVFLKSLQAVYTGFKNILGSLKSAFSEVFPLATAEQLVDLTVRFNLIANTFAHRMTALGNALKPFFVDIFKAIKDVVVLVKDAFVGLFSLIDGGGGESALFSLVVVLGQIVAFAARAVSAVISIGRTSGIFSVLKSVLLGINNLLFGTFESISGVVDNVASAFTSIGSKAASASNGINNAFSSIDLSNLNLIEKFSAALDGLISLAGKGLTYVSGLLGKVFGYVKEVITSLNLEGIGALLQGGGIFLAAKKVGEVFETIGDTLKKVKEQFLGDEEETGGLLGGLLGGVTSGVESALGSLSDSLNKFQASLDVAKLVLISTAISQLAGACVSLATLSPEQLGNSIIAIAGLIAELGIATKTIGIVNPKQIKGIITLATGIYILAQAVASLGDVNNVDEGVGAIGALLLELVLFMKLLNSKVVKTTAPRISSIANSLVVLGIALNLLARPVAQLGNLDLNSLAKGLGGVFGILAIILSFLAAFNAKAFKGVGKQFAEISSSLIVFGIALNILVAPVKKLGDMNLSSLGKGLLGVAGILLILGGFFKLINSKVIRTSTPRIQKIAAALILFGFALNLLMVPVKVLGDMNLGSLAKGLVGVAATLFILFSYCALMGKVGSSVGKMLATAAVLGIMAVAIDIMAASLTVLSKIDVGSGLSMLFGSLMILAIAMKAMQGSLMGAAAMVVVSGAMRVLAPSIETLSKVDMKGVLAGLVALAGVIGIFLISAKLVGVMIPNLFLFGMAMLTIGGTLKMLAPAIAILSSLDIKGVLVGLLALGGAMAVFLLTAKLAAPMIPSIMLLSSAIGAFGLSILALGVGLALVVASIGAAVVGITMGVQNIGQVFQILGTSLSEGLVAFLEGLAGSFSAIKTSLLKLGDLIISVIYGWSTQLITVGTKLVMDLLKGISKHIGEVTETAIEIVVNFINAISGKLDSVVESGFNLMVSFLNAMADAIATKGPELVVAIEDVVLAIVQALVTAIPFFGDSAADAIERYRMSLREGVGGVKETADEIGAATTVTVPNAEKDGAKITDDIKKGVAKGKVSLDKTVKTIPKDINSNLKVQSKYTDGYNIGKGLENGLAASIPGIQRRANQISDIVDKTIRKKNQIESPSKRLYRTGQYLMQGLVGGIDSLTGEYQKKADYISTVMIGSANNSVDAVSGILKKGFDSGFGLNDSMDKAVRVNMSMDALYDRDRELTSMLSKLTRSLDGVTDTMNSRQMINNIQIDGTENPEMFADALTRRLRLNARTI